MPSDLGTLTEAAGAAHSGTFSVVLDSLPGDRVTVALKTSDDTSVNVDRLTFDSRDWHWPQPVTVQAVDDTINELNGERFEISLVGQGRRL